MALGPGAQIGKNKTSAAVTLSRNDDLVAHIIHRPCEQLHVESIVGMKKFLEDTKI